MLISRKTFALALTACAAFAACASVVRAQGDEASKPIESAQTNLDDALCRDVMILSGIERDVTIAFLHGVLVGKSGNMMINPDQMTDSTDDFLNMCLDAPNAKAMDILAESMNVK